MKQEDKDLLLRYLSMALPYKVMIKYKGTFGEEPEPMTLFNLNCVVANLHYEVEGCKPYLRPLSSMTEEEDKKRIQLGIWRSSQTNGYEVTRIDPDTSECYNSQAFQQALDFLLGEHFDIFGLIPKGLAIEVTEENNPYNITEE